MEFQITATNTEISATSRRYIERKLSKLGKHLPDIIDIKVEASEEKTRAPEGHFLVRVTVSSGVGGVFHGEERAEDLYKAVDRAADIMTRQLEKHKGKLYDRGRGNPLARGRAGAGIAGEVAREIRTERLVLENMTTAEAVERLDDRGSGFLLFLDAASGEVRLAYRRDGGGYGVIEPVFP